MKLYNFITSSLNLFCNLFYNVEVIGLDNIPKEGKIILAANHKSNLDPIFIAGCIRKRQLVGLAKKELNNIKILRPLIKKLGVITIDRDNPELSSVKSILKALREGSALALFPEGTRVKGNSFGEAKQGVSIFALKGKSDIVPISIVTNYKLFSKVILYIDKPISLENYYGQKLSHEQHSEIAQSVMDKIVSNYTHLHPQL